MKFFHKRVVMDKYRLTSYIENPIFCCPVPWWNTTQLYKNVNLFNFKYNVHTPPKSNIIQASTCIHLWHNFSINKHKIDFDNAEEDSLFRILLDKYDHIEL